MIDVDPMQDGIRPGILAVRLGHLILPPHCLGKVVLSAVRIEAGPNVGRPLERFVAMLLENCAHACFVEAVNAGREVVQAGFVALEQREIVALEPAHLPAAAHVLDDASAKHSAIEVRCALHIRHCQ